MSSIGLFAAVILISAISVFIIAAIYRYRLLRPSDRQEMTFIVLQSLLMFVILNMFFVAVYDTAGQELWSSEHQSVMILSVGLSLLFFFYALGITMIEQKQSRRNRMSNLWARVRPLLIVFLLCLIIWSSARVNFVEAAFYAFFAIVLFYQILNEKGRQA